MLTPFPWKPSITIHQTDIQIYVLKPSAYTNQTNDSSIFNFYFKISIKQYFDIKEWSVMYMNDKQQEDLRGQLHNKVHIALHGQIKITFSWT